MKVKIMVRRKLIRATVDKLLGSQGVISAAVPVVKIAMSLRAEVRYQAAEDDLSGFLYRDRKNNHIIIGVNASHPRLRQTFTIAHEIGHLVLHKFDDIHVDRQFKVWLRSGASSQGTNDEEKEANLFAAELLMPAHLLAADMEQVLVANLSEDDVITKLAEHFCVSTQAMAFRLSYLGYSYD